MKLSYLLIASALVYAIFGIAFVLVPGLVLPIYGGMSMEPYVEQLFGAEFVGFAVLNWFARKAAAGEALRAILIANLVANTIGFIVAVIDQFTTGANVIGWSSVAIYLLLALGFAYFLFTRQRESTESVAQAKRSA